MLEMFCTSTQQCHYVVWTPVGTKVFLVERDDAYIELLLNYLYKFWDLASNETEPAWHEDVFGLRQKSKEISLKAHAATMPVTFVSDASIENYTVAPDRKRSVKHKQTKCVPVTFINDSMINLIKTGANRVVA